jgi:hypothetical protein
MTHLRVRPYNWAMRRAIVFAILLAAVAVPASADPIVLQTGAAPVVNVVLRTGSITIRTWDRNAVQVEGPQGVTAEHLDAAVVAGRIPRQIPAWSQTVKARGGDATLPAEVWIVPQLGPAAHDAVVVHGDGDTTVTLPSGTALLLARAFGRGTIDIADYRGGAFFLSARGGGIAMRNVAGTGFAQSVRGPITASASSFDRVRVRDATGPIVFSNCSARQIEASNIAGPVVYDDGTFIPGLARFESIRGDVAIGVGGNAQIGAHSATGRVDTEFAGRTGGGGNDARANVGSGGPTVTATSGSGTILLYDGSLRDHATLVRRTPTLRSAFGRQGGLRARKGARPPHRV